MNKNFKEELKPRIRQQMWEFWAGDAEIPPCIRCWRPSVTIHEEPPRSLNPDWESEGPEHFIPICAECHEWRDTEGSVAGATLIAAAIERLQMVGDWKPDRIVREIDDNSNS